MIKGFLFGAGSAIVLLGCLVGGPALGHALFGSAGEVGGFIAAFVVLAGLACAFIAAV